MPDADKYSNCPDKFIWKSALAILWKEGEVRTSGQSRLKLEQVSVRTLFHWAFATTLFHLFLLECCSISELTDQNIIYNPANSRHKYVIYLQKIWWIRLFITIYHNKISQYCTFMKGKEIPTLHIPFLFLTNFN